MNTLTNLFRTSLLCTVFLTACDSSQNAIVQTQSATANGPGVVFQIPDRIRTSQAVNLNATQATITPSTGEPFNLTLNGGQFEGSIDVEPGSTFSFTLSVSENVNGESIEYATISGEIEEPVDRDWTITLNSDDYEYTDTDSDGHDNIDEVNAGSNPTNSFSTPDNPNGTPPSQGQLQFSADTFTVSEADGELIIPVTRTGGTDGRVTARYSFTNETAINGQDYAATPGVLVWEDGDSTPQNITIAIRADDLNDGEQTFFVSLFSPVGGAGIGNGFSRITLVDSTPPAQRGTIQLTSTQFTVDEDAGVATVEVERTGGSDGDVSVAYATSTGTAGDDDFTALTSRRIVWADGEQGTRAVSIPITNDLEVEGPEAFTLTLSGTTGGASLGASEATITITDTTPVPVTGQISLGQDSYTLSEGDTLDIEVERMAGADGAASIDYTITTGTADIDDFTGSDGTLMWDDGESDDRTITISALTDAILEPEETLTLNLGNATGADLGLSTATITITDATVSVPGVIAFSSASAVVAEGASVDIDVSRTGGSDGEVSVDVSAAASAEYTVSPAELVWADGDSDDQTITVIAIADTNVDDTETVSISLANATGNATLGNATITVTINDTTPPVEPDQPTTFFATDGEWEVCVAPFNNSNSSAFATQLSANEGRVVNCIKTCDIGGMILDDEFPGWGWNPIDQHSCTTARDAAGTYTNVPIYTPARETINLNLSTQSFTRGNSIWACVNETRQNAEFTYVPDQTNIIWYQFMDDGTYFYGTSADGSQPAALIGPETWSVNGRVLEIGHLGIGYRNTLFFPGSQTLHIHPTADDRLSCTRQTRPASASVQ